jgi:hypothetical protein
MSAFLASVGGCFSALAFAWGEMVTRSMIIHDWCGCGLYRDGDGPSRRYMPLPCLVFSEETRRPTPVRGFFPLERVRFRVQINLYLVLMLRSIRTLSGIGITIYSILTLSEENLTQIYNQFKWIKSKPFKTFYHLFSSINMEPPHDTFDLYFNNIID